VKNNLRGGGHGTQRKNRPSRNYLEALEGRTLMSVTYDWVGGNGRGTQRGQT